MLDRTQLRKNKKGSKWKTKLENVSVIIGIIILKGQKYIIRALSCTFYIKDKALMSQLVY